RNLQGTSLVRRSKSWNGPRLSKTSNPIRKEHGAGLVGLAGGRCFFDGGNRGNLGQRELWRLEPAGSGKGFAAGRGFGRTGEWESPGASRGLGSVEGHLRAAFHGRGRPAGHG